MRHETQQRHLICFSFAKEYGIKMKRQLITKTVMGMALFSYTTPDDDLQTKKMEEKNGIRRI